MNQTIEERFQSIEDQLKEIRKELEESLARYAVSMKLDKRVDIPPFIPMTPSQFRDMIERLWGASK
jgi:hypothetical protein